MSRILACWALATLCWGAGCSTETRVIVHLDAEEAALTKVAYLRVEVSSIDLTPRRSQDLRVAGAGVEASFPVDVPLAPLGDDASRGWVVVAELCDAKKRPLSRQRAVGGYVADETREVWLVFEESCVGELGCSARQTCSQGQCVDACVSFEGGGPCAGAMLPSNVGDLVSLHGSSERLAVQGGETWVLDTTRGSIEAFTGEPTGQPARVIRAAGAGQSGVSFSEIKPAAAGGQPLGVFGLGTLTIAEGARVIGVGQRPLVILAADEVTIRGEISVAADAIAGAPAPGAGGFSGGATMNAPGRGPGAGQGGAKGSHWNEGGGGGASFGGRGGRGADGVEPGESDGAGGAAGATHGSAALIPLVGGSGGGAGGGASGSPRGGHGGGALQISAARRIELGPSGQIDACGGGGGGTRHDGGGGGGSGGAILLEAPAVSLSGIVGANGGAGNRGGDDSTDNGPAPGGEPGRASAPGPQGSGTSGSGGDGSDADGAAKEGGTGQNSGGGGGGGGRIRVNTAAGTEVYSGLLPRPESGLATVGRIRQSGTP